MKLIAKRFGFTLIELMIVIVIMGIALAIVALNFDGFVPEERIRAEARSIGHLIELARAEAAMKGVSYGVVYDLNKNAYWLLVPEVEDDELSSYGSDIEYDEEDDEEEIRKQLFYRELAKDVEFVDVQLGEDTTIKDSIVRIEITPLGTASGHIVHLKQKLGNNQEEKEFSIELNALTAMVSFTEGRVEFEEVTDYEE